MTNSFSVGLLYIPKGYSCTTLNNSFDKNTSQLSTTPKNEVISDKQTISTEEYEKLMEEIKAGRSKSTEYWVGCKLYNTNGYQKIIEKKYEGLIPYIGQHDFSNDINCYLSNRELYSLTKDQAEKLAKVLDYSLVKLDEEYGKHEGMVYRKGYFNPKTKQYYSSSTSPKSAARHGGGERYFPYAGYSIIKTKSGHKVYDFQKAHGSRYGDSEAEVLLPKNSNYREIPASELTPEYIRLKEEFASEFFNGAKNVVYNGKRDCGEDRESILKRIKVYEECDNSV